MTISHDDNFFIKMTENALFADYLTVGNETRIIVVTPENSTIFQYSGDFEVTEIIVANSYSEVNVIMPKAFGLSAAYPNPFNPTTSVAMSLPNDGYVSVTVYNLIGQNVATLADGYMAANMYDFTWNASSAPSGMYFIRAEAGSDVAIQKVMLLK